MKKTIQTLAVLLLLSNTAACDSGDIHEKDMVTETTGNVVKLTGKLSGTTDWSKDYKVVIAAFDENDNYSLVQKDVIDTPNGEAIVLANIPQESKTVELCVVNRLRQRIATLQKLELTDEMHKNYRDTIAFEVGERRVSMYRAVADVVFEAQGECARCHGTTERAAAHLSLQPQNAYAQLVNQASTIDPTQKRVIPGDADNSWIVRVLTPGNEGLTHYKDHPNILNNEYDLKLFQLLKDWINAGANE